MVLINSTVKVADGVEIYIGEVRNWKNRGDKQESCKEHNQKMDMVDRSSFKGWLLDSCGELHTNLA